MKSTPKQKLLIIVALITLCIALITLVPENWMAQIAKFIFAVAITAVTLAVLFCGEIFTKHREYTKIKEEIGYMPCSIKYEKYRREHLIDPKTGHADVNYFLNLKNIGKDKINTVTLPITFDIPRVGRSRRRTMLNVKSISIDHNELEDPNDYYKRLFEKRRQENGKYEEGGCLQIPLDQIGGLKKGDRCSILVQVSSEKAFPSAKTNECVGLDIYHQMEVLEFVVSTKANWGIKPSEKTDAPNGVQVHDYLLKTLRLDETSNAPKPVVRENTVLWSIKKPKISYTYILWFKITRKRKK